MKKELDEKQKNAKNFDEKFTEIKKEERKKISGGIYSRGEIVVDSNGSCNEYKYNRSGPLDTKCHSCIYYCSYDSTCCY